jgi:hypothetical protein
MHKIYHIKWIYNNKEISYIQLSNGLILQENWKIIKEPKNIFKTSVNLIFSGNLFGEFDTILEKNLNKSLNKKILTYLNKIYNYKNLKLIGKEYVTDRWIIDFLYANNNFIIIVELKVWNIKISDIRQIEWYMTTFKKTNWQIKWLKSWYKNKEIKGFLIGKSNTKNYKTSNIDFIPITKIESI